MSSLRERILATASERFRNEGFARVSVDEIASSLGISKKTFYTVFASKEELVEHLVSNKLADVKAQIDEIMARDESFVAKFSALFAFLSSVPGGFGVPFLHDVERHLPHVWKRVESFRERRVMNTFAQLIEQGIQEGYIRPELSTRLFLLAFTSAVQHIIQPHVLAHESFSAQQAIGGLLELFFKGALTDVGRKNLAALQRHNTSKRRL
mgnify:FL=1